MLKDKMQGMFMGAVITAGLMISVPVIAKTGQELISVSYNNIKIVVDGKIVSTENEPFVYEGRTYLPVRDISNAIGKDVTWDGSTQTIYIGDVANSKTYLGEQVKSYSKSAFLKEFPKDGKFQMGGNSYTHGLYWNIYVLDPQSAYYNLDAQYTSLTGLYGPIDGVDYERTGTINIYGDGKLLGSYESKYGDLGKSFEIDVTGVLKLQIEFDGQASFGIADTYLK